MEYTSDNEVFYDCVNWDAELRECRKVISKRNLQIKFKRKTSQEGADN